MPPLCLPDMGRGGKTRNHAEPGIGERMVRGRARTTHIRKGAAKRQVGEVCPKPQGGRSTEFAKDTEEKTRTKRSPRERGPVVLGVKRNLGLGNVLQR